MNCRTHASVRALLELPPLGSRSPPCPLSLLEGAAELRLDASFYNPRVAEALAILRRSGLTLQPLHAVTERISPSGAAGRVIAAELGAIFAGRAYLPINGWKFWQVVCADGKTRTLAEIRVQLLSCCRGRAYHRLRSTPPVGWAGQRKGARS